MDSLTFLDADCLLEFESMVKWEKINLDTPTEARWRDVPFEGCGALSSGLCGKWSNSDFINNTLNCTVNTTLIDQKEIIGALGENSKNLRECKSVNYSVVTDVE